MAREVGQIVRRAPRTWLVRVYMGRDPETKIRKYLNKTIRGRLREAQAYLHRMLNERAIGRNTDSSMQTLNQYLDRWLELSAEPRLRAGSFRDYKGLLRRYVRPQLGMKPLASLRALDIQNLYRGLLTRGLAPRSIHYTHAVLRSALKQAVRWRLLLANPAEWIDLPRNARPDVTVFTVEEARRFMKAIIGHPYEALFALAMTTGMRPNEYFALTWADIDLVRGTISVSRTLDWKKGDWQFADTKRSRSRRVIKLQAWVTALLEKHGPGARGRNGNNAAHDLVFVSKRGGPVRASKFVRRYFKPLLREAGLPGIRLYDLRHTAATLALVAGVSPKIISEQLGHASVAFTLDVYSHVLPHMQEAAALKVETLLLAK